MLLRVLPDRNNHFKINLGRISADGLHQLQGNILPFEYDCKKQMLCSDLLGLIPLCLLICNFQNPAEPRRISVLVEKLHRTALDVELCQNFRDLLAGKPVLCKDAGCHTRLLADKPCEQMLRADIILIHISGALCCKLQCF